MGGEILALFGVVFAAALADLLIPAEDGGGTRQFLHFLTALVVLVLLLRPFLSLLDNAEGFLQGEIEWEDGSIGEEAFEQRFEAAVANRSATELKEGLYALLDQEYGILREDCEIGVELTQTGELSRIAVILSGMALMNDPEEIEQDLCERFGCTVEVR